MNLYCACPCFDWVGGRLQLYTPQHLSLYHTPATKFYVLALLAYLPWPQKCVVILDDGYKVKAAQGIKESVLGLLAKVTLDSEIQGIFSPTVLFESNFLLCTVSAQNVEITQSDSVPLWSILAYKTFKIPLLFLMLCWPACLSSFTLRFLGLSSQQPVLTTEVF